MNEEDIKSMDSGALCIKYKRLICSIAMRFTRCIAYHPHLEYTDLLQAGYIGLLKAQEGYDPDKGRSFVSYAYLHIKAAIMDEIGIIRKGKGEYYIPPVEAHLDAPVSSADPDGATLLETLPDEGSESVEAYYLRKELIRIVNEILSGLCEDE